MEYRTRKQFDKIVELVTDGGWTQAAQHYIDGAFDVKHIIEFHEEPNTRSFSNETDMAYLIDRVGDLKIAATEKHLRKTEKQVFNGFYANLLKRGLELAGDEMKASVDEAEARNKQCLWTKDFVDITVKEINGLLDDTTKPNPAN